MNIEPEVVDERGAAELVGLSPHTLKKLRQRGGGPRYCKLGRRVVYRIADLRAWRDARLVAHTGATR
ncbi:MAG TPA: helix-turn-helix domain-containing protein [Nannocystaceae bacterium]|nr:helix-turn-helix domain-containing protein [Nannocystaceae bacterium]